MSAEASSRSGALPADPPVPWEPVEGNRDGLLAQLEAQAVITTARVLAGLPLSLQRVLARGLAQVARVLDRRHANAARRFLEIALGPDLDPARREQMVTKAFETMITMTLEEARFDREVPPERVLEHFEVEQCPEFEALRASGAGALVLTAHVGSWEYLPLVTAALGYGPLYAVARPPRNKPLSRILQRTREARGVRVLHRHGAIASIPKVVAAGGLVGLLVDQRGRGKTIVAPFFGRPAHCERAVAVLARRLGVPLAFAACYRTDRPWHYRVVYPRVLGPADLAGLSLEQVTARINRELERMILACPEQYFWLHDRFRGAPPAAEPAAGADPQDGGSDRAAPAQPPPRS